MSSIFVKLKDGRVRDFKHEGRPGGSYTKNLKLENGFAIVIDEWGNKTVIPSELIDEITVKESS
jgi:hypothetical protein